MSELLVTGMAVLAAVLGLAGVAHLLTPSPGRFSERNRLIAQRKELKKKGAESRAVIAEQRVLARELAALRRRMTALDSALYRGRIATLDAGIALLEEQVRVERELIREYARADAMLEVEIESHRVAGRFEEEALDRIAARLAELEAVREANRDMRHLLEANEEVERFLHGGSPTDGQRDEEDAVR
jgi:hypothetical protein